MEERLYSILQTAVSALLLIRHGEYITAPLLARVLGDKDELFAQILSRKMPDVMFPLNEQGVKASLSQGEVLAGAGVKLVEILGSESVRGAHTGLCIADGYVRTGGGEVPFFLHPGLNYPLYDYHVVRGVLENVGDPFVAQWLNGKHPGLVPCETPLAFQVRVLECVSSMLARRGVRVACSHFEIVTLVHGFLVDMRTPGWFDEEWAPTKNGGVLIWKDEGGKVYAKDFTPEFKLL